MKRIELERAWPAAEPPPGFSERVLERLQLGAASSEPAPRRANALGWLQGRHVRWLVPPAVALALIGMLLLWPAGPARVGDVIAAEPRVVAIGERAVAEMSSGAHLRWSGDGLQQEVQQDRGAVTYRVSSGAPFRVQTPHGNVTVLGTEFRVVVADREDGEGEPMKKRWPIAGAGATLGVLLWVSVDRGSVRLSNHEEEVVLHAGQAGAIGADGIPRLEATVPSAPADAGQVGDRAAERARTRQVADAVRRHAAQRRAAALAAKHPPAKQPVSAQPTTPPIEFVLPKEEHTFGPYPSGTPAPPAKPADARRRDYIKRTVREQYFPIARDCYQELLERQPAAGGKVVLEYAIVGDGDAGVVDRVAIREDKDTIDDPEFQLCMSESMYTVVFEPPPPGVEETTVVYPIMLSPE
jgi:ferric-dicitrate binding protein FerR (iron transport regulator)